MNIATGLLNAPTVKTAGILEAIMSKGLVGKALPEVLGHANYGLSAGIGAGGSELLRRGLRRTNLNPYLADAIGVGAGGLVGGGAGATGALGARITPQIGGATAGRAAKNLLGATALGAGGIAGLEGGIGAYQAAKGVAAPDILQRISDMYSKATPGIRRATLGGAVGAGGLATLSRDARRYLAGLGTSATGGSMLAPLAGVTAGLGAPIAGAGILGAAGLKNEAVRRALVTGGVNTGTGIANTYRFIRDGVRAGGTGVANSYRFLRDGVRAAPGGSVLAGLGGLTAASKLAPALYEAPRLATLLKTMGDSPLTMGAAGGLAGLGALLNPTIRGGLSRGISGTARGLYNAPAGSVLAGLGGLTAAGALAPKVMANPEVLTKLKPLLEAAKGSPVAMGAAGGLAGLGALRSGMTRGSMINRIARNAPGGTLPALGGAGLFAAGHPFLGAASMLSAPMVNRTSSRYLGDLIKEIRALRNNKRALDGLYKKSSLEKKSHIKLAAPVFLTKPSYILDAPTMEKVGFGIGLLERGGAALSDYMSRGGEALFKGIDHFGAKATRGVKGMFGGQTRAMNRATEGLMRGAREAGNPLTRQQAQRQAEAFLRKGDQVTARTNPGSFSARSGPQTQFQGTGDVLKARVNEGVQGRGFFNRMFGGGMRQRGRNIETLEQEMYQYGRQGATPTPTTVNTQPALDAKAALTGAEQAAQRQGRGYMDASGNFIRGAEADAIAAEQAAKRDVTRLTAPVQPAQETATTAQEAVTQTRQRLDALPQYSSEQATFSGMYNPVGVDEIAAQRIRGYNTAQIDSRIAELTATGRPVAGPKLQELRKLEQMRSASNPVTQNALDRVEKLLGNPNPEAVIEARISTIEGFKKPNADAKAELDILKSLRSERTVTTPGTSASTRLQGATGDAAELTRLNNVVRNDQKVLSDLTNQGLVTNATTPQQMVTAVEQRLTQLRSKTNLSRSEQEMLTKLEKLEVTTPGTSGTSTLETYVDPANFDRARDAITRQRDRLSQAGQRTILESNLATQEATLANAEAELQRLTAARDAGLPGAQEQLTQATSNLEAAQRAARRAQQRVGTRTRELTQAQQAEQRTTDLLAAQAPIGPGARSKLQAPIQESLAYSKAKPEVVDAIGQAGLGQSAQVNERLVRLEASGVNTGELINTAANSAGLPKAVKRVNKASDSLIAEATANISGTTNLATNEAEALNMAVRQLTAEGKALNVTNIEAALGRVSNTNINAAAAELERLTGAASGSRAGEAYNQASTASREAYQKFTNQLESEMSIATGRADMAGLERTNKAIGEATRTKRKFWSEKFLGRNKGIADRTEEQVAAFNEMGALTNARVEAIRAEVALKGPNAAVAESTIPQIRSASEAIANSNNHQAAAEWSRMLQDPANIAANAQKLPKDSSLRGLLQENAPRLLEAGEQGAFALSNRSARTLEGMIPRGGRGAQGIDAEVSRVFNRDVLSRPESVEGQELIRMMDGSGANIKINGTDTSLGQALEQLNRGTGTQRSAAQKLMEGAENASAFTAEELGHLGVSPAAADASTLVSFRGSGATVNNAGEVNATIAEAAAGNRSSINQQVEYLEKELKLARSKKSKKKATPAALDTAQKRQNALADALDSVRAAEAQTNTAFETQLLQPMSRARNSLRESIAKDTYVDIGNLQRNTDVASIRVGDDFGKLYREPKFTEEGVAVFNPADITKQVNKLKKNPRNSMVTEEALTDRVIMENLEIFRAKNPEATQEQLQAAYQGLLEASGRGQAGAMELVAGGQQGGLGIGGMLGGTAVIGGGAYASNNRPTPITQAAQQMRPAASWGLSPLHAPVQYRKKTASLLAAPLHKLAMDMPKPLKVPLPKFKPNQMTKAPVKAEDVGIASPLTSMLTAPIAGGGY